jgi:hypothetical protein
MANKYLVKVAETLSNENRSLIRPVLEATAASIPADAVAYGLSRAINPVIERKYGKFAGHLAGLGTMVGVGGVANAIALKHSLHGKMKEQ